MISIFGRNFDYSNTGRKFWAKIFNYGKSHLLLIRDEAGHPDHSLCSWADGVLLVFSLADEESFRLVSDYSKRFSRQRPNLPLLLGKRQFVFYSKKRFSFYYVQRCNFVDKFNANFSRSFYNKFFIDRFLGVFLEVCCKFNGRKFSL